MHVRINRIRLEFKVFSPSLFTLRSFVLIESDWNLKVQELRYQGLGELRINRIRLEFKVEANSVIVLGKRVLIESDWNLKWEDTKLKTSADTVLIESDWNLKRDMELSTIAGAGSINKIRLEFKDYLII